MKKLTISQFMFSELNIIRNYACSHWMFILISANNEFRMNLKNTEQYVAKEVPTQQANNGANKRSTSLLPWGCNSL